MRSPLAGLAFLALPLIALVGVVGAPAKGDQPAPNAPAAKNTNYRLYTWDGTQKKWIPDTKTSKSHKALHKQGKDNGSKKNGRHVHHKYWHTRSAVAPKTAVDTKTAVDESIFTVLIDPAPTPASTTPTTTTTMFCLYYCTSDAWVFNNYASDYDMLYEYALAQFPTTGEALDCSESCGAYSKDVQYFTICATGDSMFGDETCCQEVSDRKPVYAPTVCVPPAELCPCPVGHSRRFGFGHRR
jgi:hypothetical protein